MVARAVVANNAGINVRPLLTAVMEGVDRRTSKEGRKVDDENGQGPSQRGAAALQCAEWVGLGQRGVQRLQHPLWRRARWGKEGRREEAVQRKVRRRKRVKGTASQRAVTSTPPCVATALHILQHQRHDVSAASGGRGWRTSLCMGCLMSSSAKASSGCGSERMR